MQGHPWGIVDSGELFVFRKKSQSKTILTCSFKSVLCYRIDDPLTLGCVFKKVLSFSCIYSMILGCLLSSPSIIGRYDSAWCADFQGRDLMPTSRERAVQFEPFGKSGSFISNACWTQGMGWRIRNWMKCWSWSCYFLDLRGVGVVGSGRSGETSLNCPFLYKA